MRVWDILMLFLDIIELNAELSTIKLIGRDFIYHEVDATWQGKHQLTFFMIFTPNQLIKNSRA